MQRYNLFLNYQNIFSTFLIEKLKQAIPQLITTRQFFIKNQKNSQQALNKTPNIEEKRVFEEAKQNQPHKSS